MRRGTYIVVFILFTLALLALSESIGFTNYATIQFPIQVAELAQIIGGAGSLLLALAIIILYSEQVSIQQKQEKWMEAEHQPDIYVEEWEVNKNEIKMTVINGGEGVAKQMELCCGISYKPSRFNTRETSSCVSIWQREKNTRNIVGHSENRRMSTEPIVFDDVEHQGTKNEDKYSFDEVISYLYNQDITSIKCEIRIKYLYGKGEPETLVIWSGEAEISKEESDEETGLIPPEATLEDLVVLATDVENISEVPPPENLGSV